VPRSFPGVRRTRTDGQVTESVPPSVTCPVDNADVVGGYVRGTVIVPELESKLVAGRAD